MNGTGPNTRSKRKQDLSPASERPIKQTRHTNGRVSPSENTPDVEMRGYGVDPDGLDEDDIVSLYQPQPSDSAEWQAMLQKVVKRVVSIRFCQTCSFDTDAACASEATGFVVDAEKGSVIVENFFLPFYFVRQCDRYLYHDLARVALYIQANLSPLLCCRYILTNRHVVGAGPFWGNVVFDNHEEVDAYPVYRDPVHDFGILRFDPNAIKYMPVEELPLRPDLAKGIYSSIKRDTMLCFVPEPLTFPVTSWC